MMIGSEDSRSPLGRPSSLVPPMTLQPLHSMCSGAVSPPQCFPAGVPTARHAADCGATLLYNAVVPCWWLFARRTPHILGSAPGATRLSCGRGIAAQSRPAISERPCSLLNNLFTFLPYYVCNKP